MVKPLCLQKKKINLTMFYYLKVLLFTWNVTNLQNISGEQLGAYFGYSLCVNDIDGDGRDDLIVGAPLFTDFSNNLGHYETGRVYIFYQGKEVSTKK